VGGARGLRARESTILLAQNPEEGYPLPSPKWEMPVASCENVSREQKRQSQNDSARNTCRADCPLNWVCIP
jgi:hypothetical protein